MLQSMDVLKNLNNVPVDMTLSGLDSLNRANQFDEGLLQKQQQEYDYAQSANPLRLEQLALEAQGQRVRMPGLQADSDIRVMERDQKKLMHADEIKALTEKYGFERAKRYVEGVAMMGPLMRNAAEMVEQNPLGGKQLAKQILAQGGGGQLWQPEWDELSPGQLAIKLQEIGKAFQENGTAYSQALDTINARGDIQKELQDKKNAAAIEAARIRAQNAKQLAKFKAENKGKITKETMENIYSRYQALALDARQSGNEQEAVMYLQEANKIFQDLQVLKTAAAAASGAGKIDTAAAAAGQGIQPAQVPSPRPSATTAAPGTRDNPIKLD